MMFASHPARDCGRTHAGFHRPQRSALPLDSRNPRRKTQSALGDESESRQSADDGADATIISAQVLLRGDVACGLARDLGLLAFALDRCARLSPTCGPPPLTPRRKG